MTEAPERILVRVDYDGTHDGTWISVAPYEPPIEYTGMEPQFVRADIHDALVKAAYELADAMKDLVRDGLQEAEGHEGYIREEGNHAQLDQAQSDLMRWRKAQSALSNFNKARGETQ